MFLAGLAAALAAVAAVLFLAGLRQMAARRAGGAQAIERRIRGGESALESSSEGELPPEERQDFLDRAALVGFSPGAVAFLAGAGMVGAALLLWALVDAPLLVLLAGAAGAMGLPALAVQVRERQRLALLNTQFQAALEQIVAGLRAGATLHQALEHVAAESPEPLGAEFRLVARTMGVRPVDEAIQVLPQRIPTREVELFATAVAFHTQSGGSLADVLLKVADLTRERQTFLKQVEALTAEGRMTSWLIAGMPVLLLGMFRILVPGFMEQVTRSLLGQLIIGAALGMVAVGVVIIHGMVARLTRGVM
ncbi:MAG: type II secretion system F family protein [Firmicutes bacterium]|nr:type II secretion system F family protein [Bacillota bacterium]